MRVSWYQVKALIGNVIVVDTRIVGHDAPSNHVGSDLSLFGRDMNLRWWRIVKEVLISDQKTASIDGETSVEKMHSTIAELVRVKTTHDKTNETLQTKDIYWFS